MLHHVNFILMRTVCCHLDFSPFSPRLHPFLQLDCFEWISLLIVFLTYQVKVFWDLLVLISSNLQIMTPIQVQSYKWYTKYLLTPNSQTLLFICPCMYNGRKVVFIYFDHSNLFVYTKLNSFQFCPKQPSYKRVCGPQECYDEKDVKSKVVGKKWMWW